ncbi:hypothetical protein L226DRAFT_533774 [Lentinus tigrinus ALCF2SS1-7]|uniref:uncharacterized protein n=1 Tax=Lentinus tigrinus ALCF2SS1-7 TaxID=1328758 RepID=UPI001165CC87|nr:hypothetical protein L226DRAFT_533774 [Lentinus tigrinus ALCF2SS1-7]
MFLQAKFSKIPTTWPASYHADGAAPGVVASASGTVFQSPSKLTRIVRREEHRVVVFQKNYHITHNDRGDDVLCGEGAIFATQYSETLTLSDLALCTLQAPGRSFAQGWASLPVMEWSMTHRPQSRKPCGDLLPLLFVARLNYRPGHLKSERASSLEVEPRLVEIAGPEARASRPSWPYRVPWPTRVYAIRRNAGSEWT